MDYGYVLRRAWQITWRHRVLWLFGFLARLDQRFRLDVEREDLPLQVQRQIAELVSSPYLVPIVVSLVLLAALFGLALAFLHALGRAALVDQVNWIENGRPPSVRAGWEAGKSYIWKVFLIVLLLGLPVWVPMMAGLLPVIVLVVQALVRSDINGLSALAVQTWLFGCFAPACCLSLFLAVPTGVLQRLAVRACVLEGHSAWGSITRAWQVLRDNLGRVALLWLMLAAVTIGVVLVFIIPWSLLTLGVVSPLGFLLSRARPLVLAGMCGVALLLWLLGTLVNALLETFFSASWTAAYRDLTGLGRTGEEMGQALVT